MVVMMIHPIHQFTLSSLQKLTSSRETSSKPVSLSSSSSLANGLRSLGSVKAMHALVIKQAEENNLHSSKTKMQSLIASYMNFGDFMSAATLFMVTFEETYLNWNCFSKEFSDHGGEIHEALRIFSDFRNREMYYYESNALALPLTICANSSYALLGALA